ncbi:UNVERIFIED_CONTAM: hypothetical protein HHA_215600 [Hammondia hammondi]|eukprot:XP_008886638.1 hypothetical protein HHA_215600 [Hammondia hammondi]
MLPSDSARGSVSSSRPAAAASLQAAVPLECGSSSSLVEDLFSPSSRTTCTPSSCFSSATTRTAASSLHAPSSPVSLGFKERRAEASAEREATGGDSGDGSPSETARRGGRLPREKPQIGDCMRSEFGLQDLLQRCRNFAPAFEKAHQSLNRRTSRLASPSSSSSSSSSSSPSSSSSSASSSSSSSPLSALSSVSHLAGEGGEESLLNAEILTVEEEEGSNPHVELELHLGIFDVNGDVPTEENLRAQNIPVVDSGVNLHAQEEARANSLADPVRFLLEQQALEQRLKLLGGVCGEDGQGRGNAEHTRGPLIEVLSSGEDTGEESDGVPEASTET